jgi:lipoteichoic acid synthase
MKKISKNKMFKLYIFNLLSLMGMEILFKLLSHMTIFDYSLLRIFLGINIISLLISFVLSYFNDKIGYIISLIFNMVFSIYAFIQMGFLSFIGVYMSLNTSSQLGAVKDYIKDFLNSFSKSYYLIFIPFVLSILYVIYYFNKDKVQENNMFLLRSRLRKERLIKLGITSILLCLFSIFYNNSLSVSDSLQTVNNKSLFINPNIPSLAVKNFGLIGYGLDDVKIFLNPIEDDNQIYYASNEDQVTDKTRTFDDTVWNQVITEENNVTLKNIDNYLINSSSSDTNDYTGLFEGKNVIIIMMESAGEILINPTYYPNFYKMYSEGYSFTNNYSPRNACSTGNNEFSAITSLYSIYNNCTANIYKDNAYPESLFNLFNEKGYNTVSMHDYTDAYYYRHIIHPNLGIGKYYGVDELGIDYENEYKNWASDEDFARVAMDIMLNNKSDNPFMLWMTTVSSHQPYSVSSITGDQNLSMFTNTGYSMEVQRYMSKLKILDNALGILMNRLEADGKLDDTVFVMFGDHYPYGLPLEEINEVLPYDLSDYENERTPFAIYTPSLTPTKFSQYTSYINLTPTLANLFNLDYDPRLYMGEDILSDDYKSLVTYADGSWKNNDVYYNATTAVLKNYTENNYTNEEIIDINNEINAKMNMSSLIIKNNYFYDLNEKIKIQKQENANILADKEE